MELIDTHAHIYQDEFNPDLNEMLFRATTAGISKIILPNVDLDSLEQMKFRTNQHPEIFKMTVGLHPCYVKENYLSQLEILEKAAKEMPIVAIGEIGLDYHWDLTFKNEQKICLETQLNWAKEMDLPVILHCRESMQDVIEIVRPYARAGVSGIFHCFSGTLEEAKEVIEMGFYLGIGGTFTYKKSELPMILKDIGLERIVLETDSPYLPPIPHRGKRNEPSYVSLVSEKIANELDISLEEVAKITSENARKVFKNAF